MNTNINNLILLTKYAKLSKITYRAALQRAIKGKITLIIIDGVRFIDISIYPPYPSRIHINK